MNLLLDSFEFGLHTQIYFGLNYLEKTCEILKSLGYKKVLICTDEGIVRSGSLYRLELNLQKGNMEYLIFSEVEPDPTFRVVERVKQLFLANDCDALVGIGGGSSIDSAKGASAIIANPGEIGAFEGKNKLAKRGPDVIAIPTTAGTGSEVTHATVLKDEDRKYKMGILSQHLHPKAAILDPSLLTTLPRGVAAVTGMDALTHAIESYTSTQAQPITEALGLYAIKMIGQALRPFVARRNDLESASQMMLASTIAGAAFIWGRIGAVHALAHPLGARYRIAHGMANSILLPVVMERNLSSNLHKFREIAIALGENVHGLSVRDAAELSVRAITRLISDLEIPNSISELNIHLSEEELDLLATEAFENGVALTNPRMVSVEDLRSILQAVR